MTTDDCALWIQLAHRLDEDGLTLHDLGLTDLEIATLATHRDFVQRPDQRMPPDHEWDWCGFICGRGFGKSTTLTDYVQRGVEEGRFRSIMLIAPKEERVYDLQIRPLIKAAPPWFRPEMHAGKLYWPNGAMAGIYTPEAPGAIRGDNIDLVWMTEIVSWPQATRWEAFTNACTATRVGEAKLIYDTTSKGRNEIIAQLLQRNELNPTRYPIIRGTMFQNPLLRKSYLQSEMLNYSGRRYDEEVLGKVFAEAEGAAFVQTDLDASRVAPGTEPRPAIKLLGLDPAISTNDGSDLTGVCLAQRDAGGEIHVLDDRSGRHDPTQLGKLCADAYLNEGVAGAVIETNRGGHYVIAALKPAFTEIGVTIKIVPEAKPIPPRQRGVFWAKEIVSVGPKNARHRAGVPATLYARGACHLVGHLPELEDELCTYVPDGGRSPNRYDAHNVVVVELSGTTAKAPPPQVREAHARQASEAHARLTERLVARNRGRSVL